MIRPSFANEVTDGRTATRTTLTDGRTDRRTDGQTDGRTDGEWRNSDTWSPDNRTNFCKAAIQHEIISSGQTYRQTDKQTDRQCENYIPPGEVTTLDTDLGRMERLRHKDLHRSFSPYTKQVLIVI
ncbi:hypothetical protein DPMN_137191 [Dreissena polymorpha]|uniref:Uncharacterized protein n=1 Tax=Dreissena polymorpha TaxID=45954 RepID=A0A9D4G7C2_DREPO|nr:hypothetical protein DPMN_137191 [Dreissena polymorpha]